MNEREGGSPPCLHEEPARALAEALDLLGQALARLGEGARVAEAVGDPDGAAELDRLARQLARVREAPSSRLGGA